MITAAARAKHDFVTLPSSFSDQVSSAVLDPAAAVGADAGKTLDPSSRSRDGTVFARWVAGVAPMRASVATSPAERAAAAELVRRRYAWRGYVAIGDEGRCACRQAACDHRVTFIAAAGAAVVGTLTLGVDGDAGLLVDESYGAEVDALRAAGRRVCELTRFAVDEFADSRSVVTSLFSSAYVLGRDWHDATDALVEVNPRHVGFYRRLMGFRVASSVRRCERVDAPAVLLRLEVDQLEERLEALRLLGPQLSPSVCATSASHS